MTEEKQTRKQPYPYTYYGSTVYIRHIHNSDGRIDKLEVSIRNGSVRSVEFAYGKITFSRRYQLGHQYAVTEDSPDAARVIQDRLNSILPNQFFPSYFEHHRDGLHNELQLAVVFPYAWRKIKATFDYTDAAREDKKAAVETILQTFGSWTIHELAPTAVAAELNRIAQRSKKTAAQCSIIFHHLFETVLQNVDRAVSVDWHSYHFHTSRGHYLPAYQARKRLLAPVLSELQCQTILRRCVEEVTKKADPKYFAAAVMLIEGVSLEEICALRLDCFRSLRSYPGRYLQISKEVVPMGRSRSKPECAPVKYTVTDPENIYQYRNIGVGSLLSGLLDHMTRQCADQTAFLLVKYRNKKRCMSPDAYEAWLEKTFRDVIGKPELYSDKIISSSASASDFFAGTAMHMYRSCGMTGEELLHHFGLSPKNTDGIYYADFNSESALVKAGKIQDLWLSNLLPSAAPCAVKEGYDTLGHAGDIPHQIPRLEITIDIPPGTRLEQDLVVRLTGQYGFSASIMAETPERD